MTNTSGKPSENQLYTGRYTKFDGDWRYVPAEQWRLDLESNLSSPEDSYIAHIDGQKEESDKADLWQWLNTSLSDKRAVTIIYSYLWLGESMEAIGADLHLTRQRVWQLYKGACKELQQCTTADEFKRLFV